jgi:hypothetical protein
MKEQWQELKETIIEIRDNNKFNEDVSAICKFLINYMGVLEKQMQELCEYAPFTIDELKDEDMQKLLRGFKNQQVIVTDHDCSPSVTIIEPCGDVPDINVGDMISRQAVLDKIKEVCFSRKQKWVDFRVSQGSNGQRDLIIKFIEDLPSVTPKEKTGHWIMLNECANSGYYCSECHKKVIKEGWSGTIKKIKYCPNCGTKMV